MPCLYKSFHKDYIEIVYFHIIGILKEKTQKEPNQVNIPIWAQVSSAGGSSLAITVDKKQVIRYELKKDYELEIIFKDIKKERAKNFKAIWIPII